MKVRKDLLDYVYFGIFGIIIILFLTGQFSNATGYTLVVIDNPDPNSMFPTYFQGDLFILQRVPPQEIELGDVIVYLDEDQRTRIIHRVIDIIEDGGDYYYRVKGDNPISNYSPDSYNSGSLIPYDEILGKVISRIPYLGHISLAMQKNIAIQFGVYAIAIIIGLLIVFLPSDEEEEDEEDKYFDISIKGFRNWTNIKISAISTGYGKLKARKHHYFVWLSLLLLLLLLILPSFAPLVLPLSYDSSQTGVEDVGVHWEKVLDESDERFTVVFYNTSVVIYDFTNSWNRIISYDLSVYVDPSDESSRISHTIWNTRRVMKGRFVVGGSMLIDKADAIQYNNTELTIVVTLTMKSGFTTYELDPYQETYNFVAPFTDE